LAGGSLASAKVRFANCYFERPVDTGFALAQTRLDGTNRSTSACAATRAAIFRNTDLP
jgi:hypothetical protein